MVRWLVAGGLWLTPLSAVAQTPPPSPPQAPAYELAWAAPGGCPSKGDVGSEIERLLGASKALARGSKVTADARVTPTEGGFELALTLQQSEVTRSRRLAAPTCDELGNAAALVIALAVDPTLATAKEPEPAPPTPCPEPAPAAAPPPVQCPVCRACPAPPPPPPPAVWSTGVVAGVSASYGELPRVWPRPLLGLVQRIDRHWLELSLGAAFGRTSALEGGRVATFSQWYAAPRYCLQTDAAKLRFGGCAAAELGVITASGFGVDVARTQYELWLAVGAGVQAAAKLSFGTDLVFGVDVLAVPNRPGFDLAGQSIFTPHLLVPGLRLALVGGLL